MYLACTIIGIIAGAIYNAVTDNGFDKKASSTFLSIYFIAGGILSYIFGDIVAILFLFIFF